MRTGYVLLCTEQPAGEFPGQRFLRATRRSLKLFLCQRSDFDVLELSLLGMIFGFMGCLFLALTYLTPRSFNIYWVLPPALVLWTVKVWPWAVQTAFRYSGRRSPAGLDLQVREVKFGLINHRLRVEAAGKETLLIINCTRRTLADALELADLVK
jgi:hypothetical protein